MASSRVSLQGGYAQSFEAGEQLVGSSVVSHPDLVVGVLVGRDPLSDSLFGHLAGPLEIGAVTPGRVLVAGTIGPPAHGAALDDRAGEHQTAAGDGGQLLRDLTSFVMVLRLESHRSSFP